MPTHLVTDQWPKCSRKCTFKDAGHATVVMKNKKKHQSCFKNTDQQSRNCIEVQCFQTYIWICSSPQANTPMCDLEPQWSKEQRQDRRRKQQGRRRWPVGWPVGTRLCSRTGNLSESLFVSFNTFCHSAIFCMFDVWFCLANRTSPRMRRMEDLRQSLSHLTTVSNKGFHVCLFFRASVAQRKWTVLVPSPKWFDYYFTLRFKLPVQHYIVTGFASCCFRTFRSLLALRLAKDFLNASQTCPVTLHPDGAHLTV